MREGIIYLLADSRAPYDYRYVGRTVQPPKQRLNRHLNNTGNEHVARWCRKVVREGAQVLMIEHERLPEPDLEYAEQMWIAALRAAGYTLTNVHPGGTAGGFPKGHYRHSEETRARISRGVREGKSGESRPQRKPRIRIGSGVCQLLVRSN